MPKMTVAQKREFLVEMCNCREYLKTDVELNKAVLKKHLKFLPQQKLYKFRACIEREFRMLEENCIWMSLASSFPDPFDHTINIDLVKNRREVKEWLGKNGSSLCFEVVKRLFEEKGLAIPYTFSDFEDYMKTCLDENGNEHSLLRTPLQMNFPKWTALFNNLYVPGSDLRALKNR